MSDLAESSALALTSPQLPVSWYFDPAIYETAAEDEDICTCMHGGRRALYQEGLSEKGPYQSPLEDGMMHFHTFLRRELDAHLNE